jgi:glycosyltransferase involved in cell wall biosynthesis
MTSALRLTFVVESGTDVRLVEGLQRHFELTVICRKIANGFHINWTPEGQPKVELGPPGRVAFAAFVARALRAQEPAPHIVLVQGYAAAALAANLVARSKKFVPVMLVCSPVEAYYSCRKAAPELGMPFRVSELAGLKLLARINAHLSSQYVVLSKYLERLVVGHGATNNVHVIPLYGVNVERFVPATEAKMALRARLGIPTTGKLVFFSSRIAPEKDAETVLRALVDLKTRGHDVFLINRSGGYEAFLRRASALGVEAQVLADGPVDPRTELPLFYQAADVCVQASREEGLGFSPLEALASGVPVVATSVGGLRETIRDGETGWSYSSGDPVSLADALVEVFENPDEAARRTRNGRHLVLDQFADDKVFREFEGLMRTFV